MPFFRIAKGGDVFFKVCFSEETTRAIWALAEIRVDLALVFSFKFFFVLCFCRFEFLYLLYTVSSCNK
jgi:hypothetical protein